MNRFFLVTALNTTDVEAFQKAPNPDLITLTPVALAEGESEQGILDHFTKQGFTVVGLETLELLEQKLSLVRELKESL